MARSTMNEMKERRLATMTPEERSEFDAAYEATRLALSVGATLTTIQRIATALHLKVTVELSEAS